MINYINAVILPYCYNGFHHIGGAYQGLDPVPNSHLIRHGKQISFQSPYITPKSIVEGKFLYAGFASDHFGHFLIESLSRLRSLTPHETIVWANRPKLSNVHSEILETIGVKNKIHFCRTPTRFFEIRFPNQDFIIGSHLSQEHINFLAKYMPKNTINGKKTILSRRNIDNTEDSSYFEYIESELNAHGWNIFHPQEYSIREQLDELSSSELVVGIEGSAFHSLLLLQEVRTKFIAIARNLHGAGAYHQIASGKQLNYITLELIKNADKNSGELLGADQFLSILQKSTPTQAFNICKNYQIVHDEKKIIKPIPQFDTNVNIFDHFYYLGINGFETKNYNDAIYNFSRALQINPSCLKTIDLIKKTISLKSHLRNHSSLINNKNL